MRKKTKKAAKRVRSATEPAVKRSAKPAAKTAVAIAVASAATTPATTAAAEPVKKHRVRRKRVSIGEALRKRGLDEYSFAERFETAGAEEGGVKKTDLDYLKEWSRYLEPAGPGEREENEGPVPVILMHNVDRPVRDQKVGDQPVKTQQGEAP
jgi:hypothetical protein